MASDVNPPVRIERGVDVVDASGWVVMSCEDGAQAVAVANTLNHRAGHPTGVYVSEEHATEDGDMASEGPTAEYRDLAEHPEQLRDWASDKLLSHFLDTRLLIETDSGMPTNALRMGFVYRVSRDQRIEILRRMEGQS